MAVLSQTDYRTLAINYANGYDSQVAAKQDYYDAVYNIVLLDQIRPEVDLLTVAFSTYNVMTDILQSTSSLLSVVRAINNHILNAGSYASIDAFLDDATGSLGGTGQVPQTWGDLSAAAGFTIANGNIG